MIFPSVWSYEIEISYLLSERTPVHPPYGVSTWQFPRQWQLHGGQAILKLTFPHTDLEMLVNGTVLLLQQILKQLLSVLSVYIFASFPHLISCPQNFPAQGNTTLGFTLGLLPSLDICKCTQSHHYTKALLDWTGILCKEGPDLFDTRSPGMFPDKLGTFMTGTLRAWSFNLDPSGSEFLENVEIGCDTFLCGLKVKVHPQPSFYP